MGMFCEKTAAAFFDTIMATALKHVQFVKEQLITNNC